jgi:hypothetical protein
VTKPQPFPAIHTTANARAEKLGSEAAELRAHADALLSAIDELCGNDGPREPKGRKARTAARHAA